MDNEIICPYCKQLFNEPVLLPCYHGLCLNCALELTNSSQLHRSTPSSSSSSNSSTASGTATSVADSDHLDRVSLSSETDSGVIVCTSTGINLNNSFAGTPGQQLPISPPCVYRLHCPSCRKLCLFDERGARNLPPYRIVQPIIERRTKALVLCDMCEKDAKVATAACDQCAIRYCEPCLKLCHPARGPLATHTLSKPKASPTSTSGQSRETLCPDHQETFQFYCCTCKVPACQLCINANRHGPHIVQSITSICKAQKTELSANLQQLSEKARSTTEFIQHIKNMTDSVVESSVQYEVLVNAQCDALVQAIEEKRIQLLEILQLQRESKIRRLKEEQQKCTEKLQQTTGLIHFCIESLKETDSVAFLQIGKNLINRVANADLTWRQEVTDAAPRVSPVIDFALDDENLLTAIQNLSFHHGGTREDDSKDLLVPRVIPEKCSAENNSVTVCWTLVANESIVEGFVLEIDDGNGGDFREVYCGNEKICTVDGLHFDSIYNARVKAFNNFTEGDYSELVCLQTAPVAWFAFDPRLSALDLTFHNGNETITATDDLDGHRVALGSVGFSRGIHYWEYSVDHCGGDAELAFGVARIDVGRQMMLGGDDKGYAMCAKWTQTWFQHNAIQDRRCNEGGVQSGSVIGVLLDLMRHILCITIDGKAQENIAFGELYGVFYPATSLCGGVTLTLHTSLKPPF